MRTALAMLVGLILWIGGGHAQAEPYYIHSRLVCAKDQNIAVIQFAGAYEGNPMRWLAVPDGHGGGISAQPTDARSHQPGSGDSCQLSNGVEVAYEHSGQRPSAGGMCGGAPPERIDLWVDRKRLYEWREFTSCSTLLFHSIIITPELVTLCSYTDVAGGGDFIEHGEGRPVSCEPLVQTRNALLPDYHRYPPSGEIVRSGLRFAVSADLCARVLSADEVKFDTTRLGMTYLGRAYVDFDNDGRPDPVYRVVPSYPANWTTIHVVDADPYTTEESWRRADPFKVLDELIAQARISVGGSPYGPSRTILAAADVTLRMLDGRAYIVIDKRPSGVRDTDLQTVVYAGDATMGLRTVCVFGRP